MYSTAFFMHPVVYYHFQVLHCTIIQIHNPIVGVVEPIMVGLRHIKPQLVDAPECGYLTTDKPHPRGEIELRGLNMMNGYYK